MLTTFLMATSTILFWKLVGIAADEMRYRNNRD